MFEKKVEKMLIIDASFDSQGEVEFIALKEEYGSDCFAIHNQQGIMIVSPYYDDNDQKVGYTVDYETFCRIVKNNEIYSLRKLRIEGEEKVFIDNHGKINIPGIGKFK